MVKCSSLASHVFITAEGKRRKWVRRMQGRDVLGISHVCLHQLSRTHMGGRSSMHSPGLSLPRQWVQRGSGTGQLTERAAVFPWSLRLSSSTPQSPFFLSCLSWCCPCGCDRPALGTSQPSSPCRRSVSRTDLQVGNGQGWSFGK